MIGCIGGLFGVCAGLALALASRPWEFHCPRRQGVARLYQPGAGYWRIVGEALTLGYPEHGAGKYHPAWKASTRVS